MIRRAEQALLKFAYHAFAKHLPSSYSKMGGAAANAVRLWICRRLLERGCEALHIERRVDIGYWDKVSIGRGSSIGENAYIDAHLTIGDDVMMGRDVVILDGTMTSRTRPYPCASRDISNTNP